MLHRVSVAEVDERLLKYAIIVSRYSGKWVFCKHRERNTWELPAGRKEPGEAIEHTAHRELFEETGALEYGMHPIGYYSMIDGIQQVFSYLCFAEIYKLGPLPPMEIERIELFNNIPHALTYPSTQPLLFADARAYAQRVRT